MPWPRACPIDLHPRAFKTGDAAATLVSHIPVQLWQIDDRPTYEFAVARSLAQSFWHWLEASAAEYGLVFVADFMPARVHRPACEIGAPWAPAFVGGGLAS